MLCIEEREAVMRVMETGILSGYQGNWSEHFTGGVEIQALEKEWAKRFNVKHVIAVNSASSGLWAACAAIGLTFGDEVIVTPYSMTISASVPLHFDAYPVFADIEKDYFCLDPVSVEKRISEKTRAIIVVDLFGQPYDADAINEIAERKGKEYGRKIYVIEDAAQAIDAKYRGRFAGTLGDIGVYSLNYHKHIHCGEGGIVVTDDDKLAFKIRLAMNHAEAVTNDIERQTKKSVVNIGALRMIGMNLRMTEIQAAIAREQLKKLDSIIEIYRNNAERFPVTVRPECVHSYYRYVWDSHLSYGVHSGFHIKQGYITPIYKMPLFRSLGYAQDLCPVCEDVERNIILAWLEELI